MARKTAIRITSAELGAEQYRQDARRDSTADDRTPSVLDIVRGARDQMTESELLKLARSAARLELRGADFDAEDRADCAAEIVWHVLAETDGAPPRRSSERATLTYACGLARNWRRALKRRRAAEDRAREANEDAYAASAAAMLDVLPADSPAYLAASARQDAESAHSVAAAIVDRLDLPRGGAVYATMYQWARNRTAEVCAADNGVKPNTWQQRVKRGADLIRGAFPDARELLGVLVDGAPIVKDGTLVWSAEDLSRPAGRTSPGWAILRDRDQRPREGTDAGARPTRPSDADAARAQCLIRHQCPTPGLTQIGQARIRRGYLVHAPLVAGRRYRVPGKTLDQLRADALRTIARDHAQASAREPGVQPPTGA